MPSGLTSDLHGGCGATLTHGLVMEHHWQAGLLAVRPPHTSNATNAKQRKPVSCVIAPPRRRLVC